MIVPAASPFPRAPDAYMDSVDADYLYLSYRTNVYAGGPH